MAILFLAPVEGWKGPSGPAGSLWPRLKECRLKKKTAWEQLTLQLSALAHAEQELALLKEASDRRMKSLSVELNQLQGETHEVAAVHNSRNKVQP